MKELLLLLVLLFYFNCTFIECIENLKITTISSTSVKIDWDIVPTAISYEISQSINGGAFSLLAQSPVLTNTISITSLSSSNIYTYKIGEIYSVIGTNYKQISVQPSNTIPSSSPQLFIQNIEISTIREVTIGWNAIWNANYYEVQIRSVYNSLSICNSNLRKWRKLNIYQGIYTGSTVRILSPLILVCDNKFEIKVTAYNSFGSSQYSTIFVRPVSTVPETGLGVTRMISTGTSSIQLYFFHPSADRYRVVLCTTLGLASSCDTTTPVASSVVNSTTLTITPSTGGPEYIYRVLAGNYVGYQTASAGSEIIVKKTTAVPAATDYPQKLQLIDISLSTATLRWLRRSSHTKFKIINTITTNPELTAKYDSNNPDYPVFIPSSSTSSGIFNDLVLDIFDQNVERENSLEYFEYKITTLSRGVSQTFCIVPGNTNGYSSFTTSNCILITPTESYPSSSLLTKTKTIIRRWDMSNTKVVVWYLNPSATFYNIDIATSITTDPINWISVAKNIYFTSYVISQTYVTTADTTYFVRVTAGNNYGTQLDYIGSEIINITTISTLPIGRIDNFRIEKISNSIIYLLWDDHPHAISYSIYKSTSISTPLVSDIDTPYTLITLSDTAQVNLIIIAVNRYGSQSLSLSSSLTILPTINSPSSPISQLKIAKISSNSITIVFKRPFDSTCARIMFRDYSIIKQNNRVIASSAAIPVDFKSFDSNWIPPKTELGTSDYVSFTLENLILNRIYEIEVFPQNNYGISGESMIILGKTTNQSPLNPVNKLTITSLDYISRTVKLEWIGIPEATYYKIYSRLSGSTTYNLVGSSDSTHITSNSSLYTSYTISSSDLVLNNLYYLIVIPANNFGFLSANDVENSFSLYSVVRASISAKSAISVTNLLINLITENSCEISFDAPETIYYFVIEKKSVTDMETSWTVIESNLYRYTQYPTVTYKINNLNLNSQYYIRVRGANNVGVETGISSQIISIQTSSDIPSPITSLYITSMSSTSITLAWNATPEAFKYKITLLVNGNTQIINSDYRFIESVLNWQISSLVINGLSSSNGIHNFTVYAGNTFGFESIGRSLLVKLSNSAPPAVSYLSFSSIEPTQVVLEWTQVLEALNYDVHYANYTTGSLVYTLAVSATTNTTATVSGLSPESEYVFRIKSRNSNGILQNSGSDVSFVSDVIITPPFVNNIKLHGASIELQGSSSIELGGE